MRSADRLDIIAVLTVIMTLLITLIALIPVQPTPISHHYEKSWIGPSPLTYRILNTSILGAGKIIAANLTLWNVGTQPRPSFDILTADQFHSISLLTPFQSIYSGSSNDFHYDNKTHGYVARFQFKTEVEGAYYVVIIPPLMIEVSLDLVEWKLIEPTWRVPTLIVLAILIAILQLYSIKHRRDLLKSFLPNILPP